jgi:hypothetical protein
MCNKHLLGEHGEIHKHRHNFVKHHRVDKRIELGQIEPGAMKKRHDELALEMKNRGMNHQSPYEMPDISYLPEHQRFFKVDLTQALADLYNRCENCRGKRDD